MTEKVWIRDLSNTQIDVTSYVLDMEVDERFMQSKTLKVTLPLSSPKANEIKRDYVLRLSAEDFYVTETEHARQGSETVLIATAEAAWMKLADRKMVGGFVLDQENEYDGLKAILADSGGWNPGYVPLSGNLRSIDETDKSALALLWQWATVCGCEVVFDGVSRSVDFLPIAGATLPFQFRYGINIVGASKKAFPPSLTKLYPYGKDDLSILGLQGVEYIEDLTYYTSQGITTEEARQFHEKSDVWRDSNFVDDVSLLAEAQRRLDKLSQETYMYTLNVADLTGTSSWSGADYKVADTVPVIDEELGINVSARISRRVKNYTDPKKNRVELTTGVILPPTSSSSSNARSSSDQWLQFVGPIRSNYQIRNDGDFIVGRIPLRFSTAGRGHFGLDVWGVGVGAGVVVARVIDSENADLLQFKELRQAYTNGATFRLNATWAIENATGQHNYRIRVTTEASGGPSPSNGVDITKDRVVTDGEYEASFWAMVQHAVRQTPLAADSQTFNYTGAIQAFTVPDNVTDITIDASGAKGSAAGAALAGNGGQVIAKFPVVPGTIYDVLVGGQSAWPNGGWGGPVGSASAGGGGGSSDVRPTGTTMASSIIVAPGGGGSGEPSGSNNTPNGGEGGFTQGGNGYDTSQTAQANGATQVAGGAGGNATGEDGSFGQGGDGAGGGFFDFDGGGGGGGWYGGEGGAVGGGGNGQTGGGGGSGWVDATAYDLEIADGARTGDGIVIISWEAPE